MGIRMSGLASGLDTETIVSELVKAQSTKKTKLEAKKTKEEWTQDIWKDLNKEIYSFYTDQVAKMRVRGSYNAKKVTSTDESKVTATAGADSPNGTHTLKVKKLSTGQKWTSGEFDKSITSKSSLQEIGMEVGSQIKIKVGPGENASSYTTLRVTADTTVADFVNACKNAGINANFDSSNHRLFLNSKDSGASSAFSISVLNASDEEARVSERIRAGLDFDNLTAAEKKKVNSYIDLLATMDMNELDTKLANGELSVEEYDKLSDKYSTAVDYLADRTHTGYDTSLLFADLDELSEAHKNVSYSGLEDLKLTEESGATLLEATDAEVEFNGVAFTCKDNVFEANGIKFNLKGVTGDEAVSVTIASDKESTYDRVKEFVNAYNTLVDKLNTLFNAKSSKGYEPLTSEQKEAMTDEEVKLWEDKIKGSLLRRDETLGSLKNAMRSALATTVTVGGKRYSLASFGIETSSDYTEYGKLHIRGDADDHVYADKKDKLKAALENDPGVVADVLSGVMSNLYKTLGNKMKTSTLSSALTFYNDKKMKKNVESYEKEIKKQEDKLADMEDRYYKQFTVMEKSLAKMNQQGSYLSGFFG